MAKNIFAVRGIGRFCAPIEAIKCESATIAALARVFPAM